MPKVWQDETSGEAPTLAGSARLPPVRERSPPRNPEPPTRGNATTPVPSFERSDDFAFDRAMVNFRAILRADGALVDTSAIKTFTSTT
jgi:hypothetical protein